MDSLNDKLKDIEQNFLKKKSMKSTLIHTDLNSFLELNSFSNLVLEIFGDKGLGKTSILYKLIADLQKQNQLCMLINADYSYDSAYAQQCQIVGKDLILVGTNNADKILEILTSIKNCYIFIDSIAGLDLSQEVIDKLISIIRHNHLGLVYTNQIRDKKSGLSSYGRKILKLYADKRIRVTKSRLEIIK